MENSYRGRGLAKPLLDKISKDLMSEQKTPYFYCYGEKLKNYYISLGWSPINEFVKLERIEL